MAASAELWLVGPHQMIVDGEERTQRQFLPVADAARLAELIARALGGAFEWGWAARGAP